MKKLWKPVKGYEDCYEVCNDGSIRSIDRICGTMPSGAPRHIKGQKITPFNNGNGYLMIHLKRNGTRKPVAIHRIVAEAFLEKPSGANVVNHIDYNRSNNSVDNLEWCTQKQNTDHSRINMTGKLHKGNIPSTGEKYIRYKNKRYIVVIKEKYCGSFLTLEEAMIRRGEILTDGEKALVNIY